MTITTLFLAGGILWLLFGRGGRDAEGGEPPPGEPPPPPADTTPAAEVDLSQLPDGAQPIIAQVRGLGLDDQWAIFLSAVAYTESRFSLSAKNTSPGERAAAKRGYDRNASWLATCGLPEAAYTWGSGGWYGFLPTSLMAAWRYAKKSLRCMDPREVVKDPRLSTIAAIDYARRVMRWPDWGRSQGDWYALRRAWASPGLSDASRPDIDSRFRAALQAIGVPPEWATGKVPPVPPTWDAAALAQPQASLGLPPASAGGLDLPDLSE